MKIKWTLTCHMPDLTTVLPAGPVAWNFGQHTQETEFKRAAEGLPLIKQLPFALFSDSILFLVFLAMFSPQITPLWDGIIRTLLDRPLCIYFLSGVVMTFGSWIKNELNGWKFLLPKLHSFGWKLMNSKIISAHVYLQMCVFSFFINILFIVKLRIKYKALVDF